MNFLPLRAYYLLIVLDFYLVPGKFHRLYRRVRNSPVASVKPAPNVIETVCSAINLACIWYPKEVLCLQRSAAGVCLLRRYGIPAQMIVGARRMPFKAHAWVEVSGKVVNDKSYTREMYAELDRC
jgi:hypothetical protein